MFKSGKSKNWAKARRRGGDLLWRTDFSFHFGLSAGDISGDFEDFGDFPERPGVFRKSESGQLHRALAQFLFLPSVLTDGERRRKKEKEGEKEREMRKEEKKCIILKTNN
ncbi:MAG: hypothetical protein LBF85_01685 [Tannerella sp.]|nr:hypothetical protein [Tannerella sp.]